MKRPYIDCRPRATFNLPWKMLRRTLRGNGTGNGRPLRATGEGSGDGSGDGSFTGVAGGGEGEGIGLLPVTELGVIDMLAALDRR